MCFRRLNPFYNTATVCLFIFLFLSNSILNAEVLITSDKAIETAYPNADSIGKKALILTDKNARSIEKKYKVNINSGIVTLNIARMEGNIIGYSIIDTHTLRSKSQTIMVFINPDGHLNYVEILAFYEPPEYKASGMWLDLFRNKTINDDLRSGHDIPNMSGATISSNGTAEAVRRVLAVFDYYIHGEKIN